MATLLIAVVKGRLGRILRLEYMASPPHPNPTSNRPRYVEGTNWCLEATETYMAVRASPSDCVERIAS